MLDAEALGLDRVQVGSFIGWISIGCWIVVYTPQIWTCYVLKSGDGLSVAFLIIWLIADLAAWVGAAIQDLLPTVQYLAAYYTLCECTLLGQVYWYRYRRRLHPHLYTPLSPIDESAPLLPDVEIESVKRRRLSETQRNVLGYGFGIIVILLVGVMGWKISGQGGKLKHGKGSPGQGRVGGGLPEEVWDSSAQVVGWLSALLYIGARFPQIRKNVHTKCVGLAMGFFCFSLAGNFTYSASILIPSLQPQHIWVNLAWLAGSLGTIALDFFVLGQFWVYRHERRAMLQGLTEEEDDPAETA